MNTTPSSTVRSRANFASGISRALRRHGIQPLPSGTARDRQGIRVTAGPLAMTACIAIDIDLPRKAARIADDVEAVLAEEGYTVERNRLDANLMTASR